MGRGARYGEIQEKACLGCAQSRVGGDGLQRPLQNISRRNYFGVVEVLPKRRPRKLRGSQAWIVKIALILIWEFTCVCLTFIYPRTVETFNSTDLYFTHKNLPDIAVTEKLFHFSVCNQKACIIYTINILHTIAQIQDFLNSNCTDFNEWSQYSQ